MHPDAPRLLPDHNTPSLSDLLATHARLLYHASFLKVRNHDNSCDCYPAFRDPLFGISTSPAWLSLARPNQRGREQALIVLDVIQYLLLSWIPPVGALRRSGPF